MKCEVYFDYKADRRSASFRLLLTIDGQLVNEGYTVPSHMAHLFDLPYRDFMNIFSEKAIYISQKERRSFLEYQQEIDRQLIKIGEFTAITEQDVLEMLAYRLYNVPNQFPEVLL